MKKSLFLFFTSLSLIFGVSLMSFAQTKTPRVNKRQHHQQKRIFQGVKSEELTKKEFYRLEKEQTQIRRMERKAKSDGDVTKKERAKLLREQNQASRHIYKQKHDKQDRN